MRNQHLTIILWSRLDELATSGVLDLNGFHHLVTLYVTFKETLASSSNKIFRGPIWVTKLDN